MEKSRDSTDANSPFYGHHKAYLREWGWACVLIGSGVLSHLWREAAWESRQKSIPRMTTVDLLCWMEQQPTPFRRKRRTYPPAAKRSSWQGGGPDERSAKFQPLVRIDINRATASEWDELPGFGPVLSERVVKFRSALGGFCSAEQLYSVYGLDSVVVDKVLDRLDVDPALVRPLCLDSISFGPLVRHPAFSAEDTRRVLRAWGRGGVSLEEFWSRLRPTSEERTRWQPYLDLCTLPKETPPL